MAMALGGAGTQKADINVTPLVDVLLVLLIIFMVISPVTPKGLDAIAPQPPKDKNKNTDTERTVVVQVIYVAGQRSLLKINSDDTRWEDLKQRLTDIYKTRAEKILFIKGDDNLPYNDVAQVIDTAHGADPDIKIGLITAKLEAGN